MAEESEQKRGPVKVELVIQKEETGPTFGQKLRRLVSIGLAGSALTAIVGSIIAHYVMPSPETAKKCQEFVEVAVDASSQRLLLTQSALVAGGFVVFFLIAAFWRKKPA
jgi:hypothetical protein